MKKLLLLTCVLFSLQLTAQEKYNDQFIKSYLSENLDELDLLEADIEEFIITRAYESNKGMLSHIYFAQSIDGIPVEKALINLTILNKDRKVVYYGNNFIKDLSSKIVSTKFSIDSKAAVNFVQDDFGYVTKSALVEKVNRDGKITYEMPVYADKDIVVQKKYFYNKRTESVHPTWEVEVSMANSQDHWVIQVDGNNGEVLNKNNLTVYCNFGHGYDAHSSHSCEGYTDINEIHIESEELKPVLSGTYNVFPIPLEGPSFGDQELVSQPHSENASPYGWHDTNGQPGDEFTITRGNNAHAYETDPSNGSEPDGGADLLFDFEYDDLAEPQDQKDYSVTQLFYLINMAHDITYELGFDESTGNFQQNNYGNGGSQNDQVNAVIDYTFANNASMGTSPLDGNSPSMTMGVFDQTGSTVRILSPEQLEGGIDFSGIGDDWGYPNYDNFDVTADIAIAFDGNAQGATQCCDDIVNTSDVQGKIALIDRGGCEFGSKALRAENAGAVGCIICNVSGVNGGDGEEGILMGGGADGVNVTIPAIFLPLSMCNRIRSSINSGTPVEMQIKPDDNAGASLRGSALDNGIILHEFMHGVATRMSGGAHSADGTEGMGEGWSDLLTLALTHREGDQGSDPRGIGTYALGENTNGPGIRRQPFSTDMSVNSQTYADLPSTNGRHSVGELWVGMTWDMYWNFIEEYGYDPDWTNVESGNFKAMKLIMEGFRLQPAQVGFIDGRDAIIGADQIFYNGENECLIWNAFSRRGLGINADQGNTDDINDGTANFENSLRCNPRLDIKREVSELINAGDKIDVTTTVTNFTEAEQTNVVVRETLPAGLTFIDGSSNFPATVNGNELSFDLGAMASEEVISLTYEVASPGTPSSFSYYDDLQDNSQYIVDFANGFNNWSLNTSQARSGTRSVNIPDITSPSDIRMVYQDLQVTGDNPTFRFWHKFETNSGA